MKKNLAMLVAIIIAISTILMTATLTGCQTNQPDASNPADSLEGTQPTDKPDGDISIGQPEGGNSTGKTEGEDSTGKPEDSEPAGKPEETLTFEQFLLLTPEQQQEYMNSYDDIMDFLEWYSVAEEAYKKEHENDDIIADGDINIGDFIN